MEFDEEFLEELDTPIILRTGPYLDTVTEEKPVIDLHELDLEREREAHVRGLRRHLEKAHSEAMGIIHIIEQGGYDNPQLRRDKIELMQFKSALERADDIPTVVNLLEMWGEPLKNPRIIEIMEKYQKPKRVYTGTVSDPGY